MTPSAFETMGGYTAELHKEREAAKLLAQLQTARAILSQIAYPRRGTPEETMDIFDAAELIRSQFAQEDLEPLAPDADLGNLDAAHARMWHTIARELADKHGEKLFFN
jgi:hypothetical protein